MKISSSVLRLLAVIMTASFSACSQKNEHLNARVSPLTPPLPEVHPCDTLKEIIVKNLSPNTLTKSKTFQMYGEEFEIKPDNVSFHLQFLDLSLSLKTVNYAFDTILRGCSMRLIVHRNILSDVGAEDLLLNDVNFFLNELNVTSCYILDQFPETAAENFGDMLFYDEVDIDENSDKIKYRFVFYRFSGGGSSLKGDKTYEYTLDEFRKICELPMSAYEERKSIGTLVSEK